MRVAAMPSFSCASSRIFGCYNERHICSIREERQVSFQRVPGLVSIVITVYNKVPYLTDCLTSLLNQTYSNWELIVIDDASTDGSYEFVLNWLNENEPLLREAKGIYTLRLPRNSGYAGAITAGMYLAKGEYIAIQDADDLS